MKASNEDLMNHHIRNLYTSAGIKGYTTKYEYITSQNELVNSYLHRMDDLGYPLRVEPKRDRYVVNRKALEDALEHATEEALRQMGKEINDWVDTEVRSLIEDATQDVLNCISVENSHFVVLHSAPKHKSTNWALRFASDLGKALGKTIGTILDETLFPRGKY